MKQKLLLLLISVVMSIASAFAAEGYAVYTSSNNTLTFYYGTKPDGAYSLNTSYNIPDWCYFGISPYITRVVFDSSFAQARPISTSYWFNNMQNLKTIVNLNYLNTSNVVYMMFMFSECKKLTSIDLSNFNTENVMYMENMFLNCSQLTELDLSHFNPSKVVDMTSMFDGCTSLTSVDLSNFSTSNVIYMSKMFDGCSNLTSLDLSRFNTSNVKVMNNMFHGCKKLASLDLSSFNTSIVTEMSSMFSSCTELTSLDLSSFNTIRVTDMSWMFFLCEKLKTVKVSDLWSTYSVESSNNMFFYCSSIVGGAGTTYNASHTDASYAHIDEGFSNPGYFTEKQFETYDLWINGVQVTSENKNGVIGPGISGSVTYEPNTNTLTLNNATLDIRDKSVKAITTAYGAPANFKIKLEGENKVLSNTNYVAIDIKETQDFTIYGSGSLHCGGALYLDARDHITNDATMSYIKDCELYAYDIMSEDYVECLTINNADVTTEYLTVGSDHNGYKGLTLVNSYIALPANGIIGDIGSIIVNGEIWYGHVEIKKGSGPTGLKGDVNGDGRVNVSDVSTLINMILGIEPVNKERADVNGDDKVNVSDVTALINIILGTS